MFWVLVTKISAANMSIFSAGSWCDFARENPWVLAPSTPVAIRWQEMGTFASKNDDFACRFLSNEHKKKPCDWNGTYFNQRESGMEWNGSLFFIFFESHILAVKLCI